MAETNKQTTVKLKQRNYPGSLISSPYIHYKGQSFLFTWDETLTLDVTAHKSFLFAKDTCTRLRATSNAETILYYIILLTYVF